MRIISEATVWNGKHTHTLTILQHDRFYSATICYNDQYAHRVTTPPHNPDQPPPLWATLATLFHRMDKATEHLPQVHRTLKEQCIPLIWKELT